MPLQGVGAAPSIDLRFGLARRRRRRRRRRPGANAASRLCQWWRRATAGAWLSPSIDKKREDAIAYLRAKGHTFPSTLVTPEIEKTLPRAKGLPITVVLGRDGRVVMAEAAQLFAEDIDEIARLL